MYEHHHHHHNHSVSAAQALSKAFVIGIVINLVYIVAEAGAGFWQNSMGLLADAGHNLGDVASLALSLLAVKLSEKVATKKYTYGYKKSTILVSLVNAVILLVAVGAIIVESIEKIVNPQPLEGLVLAIVAGIGVAVNAATAWLFVDKKDSDLNVKGAYLHMAMDALVSVGVVISGIVIHYTGWYLIDPIIGLVVAAIILISTWHLLTQSVRLTLDGVPENVDMENLETEIAAVDGVENIHHIHVWALSTTDNALTAHILLTPGADAETVKKSIKTLLNGKGVSHATIETETTPCNESHCNTKHIK